MKSCKKCIHNRTKVFIEGVKSICDILGNNYGPLEIPDDSFHCSLYEEKNY